MRTNEHWRAVFNAHQQRALDALRRAATDVYLDPATGTETTPADLWRLLMEDSV